MKAFKRNIFYFYLMAVLFSWTLFFITDAWLIPKYAKTNYVMLIALYGHMAAMMGPMIASILMSKYFQKTRLLSLNWSERKFYLYAIYGVLIIWIIPALMFLLFDGGLRLKVSYTNYDITSILSYLLFGWLAGVGEEYGWSGYILTELSEVIGKTKAIVVSGSLRGLWHLPLLIIPVMLKVSTGKQSILELFLLTIVFAFQLIISNIFFSALWGYVWFKTKSIPLLGWMHFMFDLARDFSILFIIGFGESIWFKYGWVIPFLCFAYTAFQKIAKEEGYSSYLSIFRRKSA